MLAPFPHASARLGAAGRILALLRSNECRDIVLVGPVRRPSLLHLRPDAEGARLLARIGRAAFAGDDGFLAAIVRVLGEEGFRVLGAHEVLTEAVGPARPAQPGRPDAEARADIARAVTVVRALGAVDVGQGCVVQQGIVLAVEAIEGTDAMVARAAALRRPGRAACWSSWSNPGRIAGPTCRPSGPARSTSRRPPGCAGLRSRRAARC